MIDTTNEQGQSHFEHIFDDELEFLNINKTAFFIDYDNLFETFEVTDFDQFEVDKNTVKLLESGTFYSGVIDDESVYLNTTSTKNIYQKQGVNRKVFGLPTFTVDIVTNQVQIEPNSQESFKNKIYL